MRLSPFLWQPSAADITTPDGVQASGVWVLETPTTPLWVLEESGAE